MLESTTTTIGAATRVTFNVEDIVTVEPATIVTLTLNGEDIVIGDTITTFVSFFDMNYNILANEAIVSSANGLHATINTRLTKDIIFKQCCPKNDFNYYDNNDNGGEGFGILIGNSESIEIC